MSHYQRMELKGVARDAHESFPIRFDYSDKNTAFFIGCKVESNIEYPNGDTFPRDMEIRAFGETAESLAHVQAGDEITVAGRYEMKKVEKDGKTRYYPIVTVDTVIEA